MKLIKFIGKDIRGYLNHTIEFRDSVTFLIGVNGSGKTSVLKLIKGLTCPSYKLLESIEYSFIQLYLVNDGKSYTLSSTKSKDEISITINGYNSKELTDVFIRIKPDDRGMIDSEDMAKYSERFASLPVCRVIKELSTPLFIGIDRMPDTDVFRYIQNRRRLYYISEHSSSSFVDRSLMAIQEMIYDIYRKNASKQQKYSEEFRTNIITEAVGLITSIMEIPAKLENIEQEIENNESRRCHFLQALQNAGIEDAEKVADGFFSRQREMLEILNKKDDVDSNTRIQAIISLFVSRAQMDKIDSIISHEKIYEQNVNKLNEQFIRFVGCVNLFFKQTGKELKIMDNGLIKVLTPFVTEEGKRKSHFNEISALSSGEKQVVALIGLLIFTPSPVRPEVLIIDEPELSLHLTWQEIFVDAILQSQPNFQFVLATHSPTIISRRERRIWCEDLSKKIVH